MHVARFVCRSLIGGLFVAHGTQKLFGWFGGSGIAGTEKMMAALKLEPAKENAYAAGVTEAGAGALLVAGLATPLAASGLIGVMTTAIRTAHWSKGFWNYNGGYEYNLVLCATLAALAESGPGEISLDHMLGIERRGTRYAVGAVALGVGGSLFTVASGRRAAARLAADAAAHPAVAAGAQPAVAAGAQPAVAEGTQPAAGSPPA